MSVSIRCKSDCKAGKLDYFLKIGRDLACGVKLRHSAGLGLQPQLWQVKAFKSTFVVSLQNRIAAPNKVVNHMSEAVKHCVYSCLLNLCNNQWILQ